MAALLLKGMAAATLDSFAAAKSTKSGPADLGTLAAIQGALAPVRGTLPQLYTIRSSPRRTRSHRATSSG